MEEFLFISLSISALLMILLAWRGLYWIWWKPMKLERYLREQGIRGHPYKLWYGNNKDDISSIKEARSKSMTLSHDIGHRVLPLIHQTIKNYVIRGPPYKFLYGNLKDSMSLIKEAQSKPINLSHDIGQRVLPFIHQTIKNYGNMSVFWFGATPRVIIMDPELIKDVLSNKFGHFAKIRPNPLTKLLITGLVSYEGEQWAKHRRIINPAFHLEKLKRMLPAFYTSCSELITRWQKLVASMGSCELDVWPELHNLTGDVISRTAFGSSYKEGRRIFQLQTEQAELAIEASRSLYIPGFRLLPTTRNNRMKDIDREIQALLRGIINNRDEAIKMGKASNDDLLGLLMESNIKEIEEHGNSKSIRMSIEEVIEECKLFYFSGQETTSVLLVWTMVVLSMHPEWQVRAQEEVFQVFGKSKPDFDGLNQLKIVTMILYEVLRLYPPLFMLIRCTYKKMKLGEITLPPGVQLAFPIVLIHQSHEIWGEDAKEFKPERFLGGISKATKNQVSFFPFGWGPRICIGQNFAMIEAKMALAMILQHFSFELSATYAHAPSTIITLQPQHGAQIILHKL